MKWNANQITEFLMIYEQFPVLWNTKLKDYSDKKLRDELFKQLYNELSERQLLPEGTHMKGLKAKIKSIKDVHRQELNKIEKSKKSGCDAEDVYIPKLVWFDEASYLEEFVSTRSSKSSLDEFLSIRQMKEEEGKTRGEPVAHCSERIKNKSLKSQERSPPMKRFKRQPAAAPAPCEVDIQQLEWIAQNMEKPYDQFGRFVATELRQLPLREAILLQREIQNSIIRYKLASLESATGSQAKQGLEISSSGHPQAGNSSSSNEGHVLNEVIVNTSSPLQ